MFLDSVLLAEVVAELVAAVKMGAGNEVALVEVEVEDGLAAAVRGGAGIEVALVEVEVEGGLAATAFFA